MEDKKETKTVSIDISKQPKFKYNIGCIICSEPVELTEMEITQLRYNHPIHSKVCDKCRMAIMFLRNQIE